MIGKLKLYANLYTLKNYKNLSRPKTENEK